MINFTYEEVSSLKVPILREELRNIGLSSQGLKAELIEGVWSHYEEQRNLQDRPDREVPTPNLLPNAIEIGETTDQNGYIWNNYVEELLKYTDLVLLDIKHLHDENHKEITGVSNKNILTFAKYLEENNKKFWIRHVFLPEYSDDDDHIEDM